MNYRESDPWIRFTLSPPPLLRRSRCNSNNNANKMAPATPVYVSAAISSPDFSLPCLLFRPSRLAKTTREIPRGERFHVAQRDLEQKRRVLSVARTRRRRGTYGEEEGLLFNLYFIKYFPIWRTNAPQICSSRPVFVVGRVTRADIAPAKSGYGGESVGIRAASTFAYPREQTCRHCIARAGQYGK